MPNRNLAHWTPKKTAAFLENVEKTANIAGSARAVGMSRASAYERKSRDPAFAAAWNEAVENGLDHLEGVLFKRALNDPKNGTTPAIFLLNSSTAPSRPTTSRS